MEKLFLATLTLLIILVAVNICYAQTQCTNEIDSSYGNRICRSDVDAANCNWPSGTETVNITEKSPNLWEVNFSSTTTSNVNVFVVYGRIISITQPNWKTVGYVKPGVCSVDSNDIACAPQIIGTHNYCDFKLGSDPLMVDLSDPSTITSSNPARGFMPLPFSNAHSAIITINSTEEALRRNIPIVLYYQFTKELIGSSYSSWCMPGPFCNATDCPGKYQGCFGDKTIGDVVVCVKQQNTNTPIVLPGCWHEPWESSVWDKVNLTSQYTSCIEEGQPGTIANSPDCCANLTKISCGAPNASNICTSCTDSFFCTNCGNGICGTGENKCNCPQDCVVNASSLNCSTCDVGSTCTCTVSGCNSGLWLVRNTTYPPAIETKSSNLPPMSISFTPTAVGSLEAIAICDNPVQTFKANIDVRGAMLSCPSCYVGRECECNVTGCSNGTFAVMQNSTFIKNITFPPVASSIKFTSNSSGVVTITATCYNPTRGPSVISVSPATTTSSSTTSSSTTTTVELKECPTEYQCCNVTEYKIKSCSAGQACNKNKCEAVADYSGIIIIIFIILILIAAPFLLYSYFIRRKSKEKFDQLYKRWSGRRFT